MLQRLPIAIAQVQARNTSANLLNEISHFFYSLRQTNFSKELYNDLINSVYIYRDGYYFMNSENSKTSDLYRFIHNLADEMDI